MVLTKTVIVLVPFFRNSPVPEEIELIFYRVKKYFAFLLLTNSGR